MRIPVRSRSFTAAWNQLAAYPTRMVAVVLAIVLGVGFVAATLVFGATYRAGLGAALSARYVPTDVVVGAEYSDAPADLLAQVRAVPGVDTAEALTVVWTDFSSESARGMLQVDVIPGDERLRWFGLAEGAWPASTQEILIDAATAASTGLHLGSTVTVTGDTGETGRTVTVAGIADTKASAFSGAQNQAFVTGQLLDELAAGGGYGPVVVIADDGVAAEQLRDDIAAALPAAVPVVTSAQQITDNLANITGGAMVLTIVLLGFAITAVVASGIVIANTFTILLTQRRRHIALTRCIGGSRGQLRREVLAEASVVGAVGSVIGIAVGIGTAALGARLAGLDAAGPVIPVLPVVLVGLGGIAFTAVAAYAPASRAMRIAPLAALRPVADTAEQRRLSRLRLAVAGSLTAAGVLLMSWAVWLPSLLVAMAGGAVSACGILLLTRTFLPAVLRVVGRLGGIVGPPGRLAAANASRNPARAASTTAALMLGVGLIVTLQVGASSAEASLDRSYAERFPVDVAISSSGPPVSDAVVTAIAATDGIATSGVLRGAAVVGVAPTGDAGSSGAAGRGSSPGTDPVAAFSNGLTILGVTDEAAATLVAVPAGLRDDTVILPNYLLSSGLAEGDRITVTTATGAAEFVVAAGVLASAGGDALITTAAGLARLAPRAPVLAVWAGFDGDADLRSVMAAINQLVAAEPDLSLGGSAPERAAVSSALGTIITLATALLAVAVIIAIVGIGNTLGLSVIERTRESALLRALGLQRRQLRLMLAVEAALLAVVGAAVGVLAGIGYGWVGAASAFGEAGEAMVLDVPWAQLGLVLLLAVIAALIASVLPARRAGAATPIQALADV
jgi:putative ABC transport system permease protein